MSNAREHSVRIRLSHEEKRRLERNANTYGCTTSELIRRTAIYGQNLSPIVIDMEVLQKTYTELRKQGGNLNQLMRSINTLGLHRHDPREVQDTIEKTSMAVEEVHDLILDIRDGKLSL